MINYITSERVRLLAAAVVIELVAIVLNVQYGVWANVVMNLAAAISVPVLVILAAIGFIVHYGRKRKDV